MQAVRFKEILRIMARTNICRLMILMHEGTIIMPFSVYTSSAFTISSSEKEAKIASTRHTGRNMKDVKSLEKDLFSYCWFLYWSDFVQRILNVGIDDCPGTQQLI